MSIIIVIIIISESTQREQKNAVTSFIDASNVYGSSLAEQEALRDGGRLYLRGFGSFCIMLKVD